MSTPTDQPAPAVAYPYQTEPSPEGANMPPSGDDPAQVAPFNPDNPPWGLLVAVGVVLGSFVLIVFAQLVGLIPYFAWRAANALPLMEGGQPDKNVILISILAMLPAHILTLALAWLVVTSRGKRPFWNTLGWGWSRRYGVVADLAACVGITLGLYAVGIALFYIFGNEETDLVRMLNSSPAARYGIVAMAVLTAPVVEEVVYRGIFYPALQRRIGTLWGVVGVMFVFALIHVPQYYPSFGAISAIGVLSLTLTLVRAYTGRLLPCVIIHTIFNSLSSVAILLEPHLKNVPSLTDQTTSAFLPLLLSTSPVAQLIPHLF
ncbi:MAG TPA: type II CAAX endopeptidase family protein [Pyrinomonadaceae bacterium]